MTSKRLVSGKHALTVRVNDDDYEVMRIMAAVKNMSVNEMIVEYAVEGVKRDYGQHQFQQIE